MAARHQAVLRRRHGHGQCRARDIVDRVRQAREVVVARLRREVVLERLEVVLVTLEIFLLVIAQRLAVSAGLVCATMSAKVISIFAF